MTAAYLAEIAPAGRGASIKPFVELLAARFQLSSAFSAVIVAPFLQDVSGGHRAQPAGIAALVLAFMSVLTICSPWLRTLFAVPRTLRGVAGPSWRDR